MLWCKVDANLDTNHKIDAAGFWGSTVYQFLLRLNRLRDATGQLPIGCADGEYLARHLNLHGVEGVTDDVTILCRRGFERCVDADLLRVDDATITIVGWDEDWRGPKSDAERARDYRQRQRAVTGPSRVQSDAVTDVTTVTDQSSVDQSKVDQSRSSPVAATSPRRRGGERHSANDIKTGKVGWLEKGMAHFGIGQTSTRTLLVQLAESRKTGIADSLLGETVRALSVLSSQNAAAYDYGLEQILLHGDFEFAGKPSRVVNYIKSCMASYRPNAQRTPRSPRRDPNNLTGDDLRELRLKLESEGR